MNVDKKKKHLQSHQTTVASFQLVNQVAVVAVAVVVVVEVNGGPTVMELKDSVV